MVRGMGRSYSRGGGRGSYRGSSSSNYHNSSSSRDDGGRDGGRSSYGHGGYGSSSGSSHRGIGSSSSGGGGGGGSSGTGRFGSSSGGHYESSSYNGGSRSTTSKYQSSSDRYGTSSSTSSRHNDDHKRPYKRSSRDRLSSDRKRSRTEGGSRRSLEYSSSGAGGGGGGGGGSSSNDYNSSRYDNGNNSYSSRRNDSHSTGGLGGGSSSSSSRRSPIHNMSSSSSSSRPSAPFRTQRDSGSSSHRSNERMGPPKSVAPRRFRGPITTSSSSTYRGRGSSLRGIRRPRGTMLRTSDLRLRRRFPLRTTNDTLHRIRLARLRSSSSSIKKRSSERTKKSWSHDAAAADGEKTPNASEKSDKTSIKDEKLDSSGGGAPAVLIGSDAGSTEKLTTTGENGGGGGGGGTSTESPVKTKNSTKSTSSKIKTDETTDDTNHNKERNNSHSIDGEQQHTKDADDIDKKRSDKDIISRYTPRKSTFIKLTCTHCRAKCLTFKEYTNHLYSRQHQVAIKRLSLRQRAQLTYMRQAQRNAQREIEDKIKDSDDQIAHFCLLCRLNYRSSKVDHQLSEAHRSMKKFLMPYCSVCRLVFKSPIIYETHRCSLDHIKRKARQELNNAASEEDERDLDLEQFMTVDSIGDVDENNVEMEDEIVAGGGGGGGSGDTVANSGSEKTNDDSVGSNAGGGGSTTTHNNSSGSKTRTTEVNVGNEHVKKVEVYFCELCRYYLPKEEEFESALKNHCASRSHLRSYVRFKGNQNLRLAAEKIHRRHQEREAKKDKEAKPKVDSETTAEKSNATEETTTNTTASITASTTTIAIVTSEIDNQADEEKIADDKVWADVNKDLTELVQYTEANVDEEEDEESNKTTERYDRFKYSDKENDLDVSNKKDEINKVNVVVLKQQVVVAAAEVEEEEEDEEEEEEQEEDEEEDDRVQLTNENSTEIDSNDNDVVKMNTE